MVAGWLWGTLAMLWALLDGVQDSERCGNPLLGPRGFNPPKPSQCSLRCATLTYYKLHAGERRGSVLFTEASKRINLVKKQATNYTDVSSLDRGQEVNVMCFGDPQESEVLMGSPDGIVKVFNTEKSKFTEFHECRGGEGVFRGLGVLDNGIITCVESGLMKVWREGSSENLEVHVGPGVKKMQQCDVQRNKVGTGGKENDLKVWDLERAEEPIFKAKNVRNDWLDLRVPVWIRDLDFIPETDKIVTCTSYHQVRVYDPNTPQRRPVLEALFGEDPLTALSITPDGRSVVAGNSHGNIGVIDLRKGQLLCSLKGCAGSVRSIQCHKSMPVVASCGLDRFMRLHSLIDKTLLHKVYLKSRLNCLLLTSRDKWEEEEMTPLPTEDVKDEEDDEVWDNMETVMDKASSKKQGEKRESAIQDTASANTPKRKKKKKGV